MDRRFKLPDSKEQLYETDLVREAAHWGAYTEEALKRGIPTWVDMRNATPLRGFAHVFGDPETEHLLRGEYKERLIQVAMSRPGCILDLGCGAGWLSLELARRGMEVHGIDVSPGQIEIARQYLESVQRKEQRRLNIQYEVGELNSLVLSPEKYVAVVGWDSLHHVSNLEHICTEIGKALVPGGSIVAFEHVGGPLEVVRSIAARLLRKPPSPFEDAGAHQLVNVIHRHFDVKREQRVLSVASFLAQAFMVHRFPIGKIPVLKALKMMDSLVLRSRLLPGEYVLIEATKA